MAGRRIALIVANDEYEHEGLSRLRAPAADAEALAAVLGDSQIGGFDVRVVHNEPAYRIANHVEDLFADRRPDDVLLLHFSGHGLKSESGELFFAAPNTRPNRLGSTAVSAEFVQRCMRESRSRSVVLLLDCCYGGAFGQGVTVRASGDANVLDSFSGTRGGGRGRAVITASSAMEYAFEGDQLAADRTQRPSVFTGAVVDGLASGEADRDEDGWVSLNELYDYVFDRVREQNPHQTPSRDVEMQGELYLARSRRRRIVAAPIPPDVLVAMKDPNMFTRLGAVTELGSRLASEDLSAALGAYEALNEIARGDIKYVADAAQAALRAIALPVRDRLSFGEVVAGSTPDARTIRLPDVPIAHAYVAATSADWIRVTETSEGFDVSVTTTQAGAQRGDLVLKGPTGEVRMPVEVVVVDASVTVAEPDLAPVVPEPLREPEPQPQPDQERVTAPVEGTPEQRSEQDPDVKSGPEPARDPESVAAAAPVERSLPGGHPPSLISGSAIVTGGVTIFIAVLTYFLWHQPESLGVALAALQLTIYAAFRLLQALVVGREQRGARLQAVVGALALVATVAVLSEVASPDRTTIVSRLVKFWIIAGVIGTVAARFTGNGLPRVLDTATGVLAAASGFVAGSLLNQYEDYAAGSVVIVWTGVLGVLLVAMGYAGRPGPAWAGRGWTRRDPIPAVGITIGIAILIAIVLSVVGGFSETAGNLTLAAVFIAYGVFRLIQSAVVAGDAGWRTPWLALTGALSLIAGGVGIVVVEKAYSAPMPVVVVALMLAVAPTQLMAAWPSPAGLARTVEIAVAILGVAAGLVEWARYGLDSQPQGLATVIWITALGITLVVIGLEPSRAPRS